MNNNDLEAQSENIDSEATIDVDIKFQEDVVDLTCVGGQKPLKVKKLKSKVWKSFDILPLGPDKKLRSACKKCGKQYLADSHYGTGNMLKHIKSCPRSNTRDIGQMLISRDSHLSFGSCSFDSEKWRELVTACIIMHDLPFQFVEYKGLRTMLQYLYPDVELVSRNTAKADTLKLYEREKIRIKNMLDACPGRISLTSDLWTSLTTDGYLCLTAHFLDKNWKLHKRILNFCLMPPPHTGIALSEKIFSLVSDWGIEEKLFSITLDNAASNDVSVDALQNQLNLRGLLPFHGEFFHLRCCAHILNLIVQDGLKSIDKSVEKIRDSIKYVKGSQQRKQKFLECVKLVSMRSNKGLSQDVVTRWNSTYLMLESALFYKRVFQHLELSDSNYKNCPNSDDWERVEKISKFLKVFYDATLLFSGTHYPTSSLYFPAIMDCYITLKNAAQGRDEYLNSMAMYMWPKFQKYWSQFSPILGIALVFDPRYKIHFIEFCYNKAFGHNSVELLSLRAKLESLFDEYVLKLDHCDSPSTSKKKEKGKAPYEMEVDESDLLKEFDDVSNDLFYASNQKSQLELYLDEPRMNRSYQLDILSYWKTNQCRFPILAAMARDILCIPVSTVASEAAFSVGGRVLDQYRSSLKHDTVEAIVCTRDWLYGNEDGFKVLHQDMEDRIKNVVDLDIHEEKNVNQASNSGYASGGRHSGPGKENGLPGGEKGTPSQTSHEIKDKERSSVTSSVFVVSNGPTTIVSGSTSVAHVSNISTGIGSELGLTSVGTDNLSTTLHTVIVNENPTIATAIEDSYEQPAQSSSNCSELPMPTSTSTVCFSSSDPVLMPSNDLRVPGAVGTIKREVGHHPSGELNATIHVEKKSTAASEISSSSAQVKMPSKSQGVGKGQVTDFSQPSSTSTHVGSSNSRPSSNYSSRSQQGIGSLKGGSNKEWKPKAVQGSGPAGASESLTSTVEATVKSQPVSNILDSEDATSKLERKLEELHLQQRQHVILPNHIHVPESERTKLSFGSFGYCFGVSTSNTIGPESDKSSTPLSGTSQGAEENVEEQSSSNQNVIVTADEEDYPEQPQSPTRVPENISSAEDDVSSNAIPGPHEYKQDTGLPSGGQQYSMANSSATYNFGVVPPILGSQLAPLENSEAQARDVSRLPSFVVQPFDPTSYYAQFYRSGADTDGRLSPFPSPGVATKYNGNVAVLPPPNPQSPQEGGVLSTAGPTPLVTQAAGLMQSSIAVTQQPVPVFRPPAGMHISHYPPNYFPYGHYFPPFYVPPPAIHQFLGNGTYPQQPQAGSVYPTPSAAAATGVKYSVPQYKPGTNTGNSTHIGMASGYGPYGPSPGGYNPSSATTAGNSTTNEDLGPSQFKENNVYIAGQQSEGSAMWVAAPGRDISSLPTSSFYNLPPQGQHVAFTPAQAGHGTFAGIYHPAQAVTATTVHPLLQQSQTMAGAVDMVGPGGGVYQQPQHAQINWPSNY